MGRWSESDVVAAALGGLGALGAAMALVAVRGRVESSTVALILVVVVVGAAAGGGRRAGAVTAVAATLAFDFFHTRPYLSLKIASADDVETTVILLVIGVLVGQVAVVGRRQRAEAAAGHQEIERLYRVAEQAAEGVVAVEDQVAAVRAEVVDLLALADCAYRPGGVGDDVPVLSPRGWLDVGGVHRSTDDGPLLPDRAFAIPVRSRGDVVGHLLCVPTPGRGVSFERRRVAVALADHLGLVLTATSAATPATSTGRPTP